jgi:hypothetical protein
MATNSPTLAETWGSSPPTGIERETHLFRQLPKGMMSTALGPRPSLSGRAGERIHDVL